MENNGPTFFRDICRTCMKQMHTIRDGNLIDNKKQCIYDVPTGSHSAISIAEILQILVPSINIDMKDNLPTTLCSECKIRLLDAYKFVEHYKEADKKFRKIIKKFETSNSNDFLELIEEKEHSVEILDDEDDVDIDEITKVEFEVEELKTNNFEDTVNEKGVDSSEIDEEKFNEVTELSVKIGPCFSNTYNSETTKCHRIKIW